MGEGDDESKRTLWCGNLSDKVTEELLYELFIQAGPLEKLKLVQGKSYAFITFQHEVSVPYTIELMSGVELFGRKLKLQFRSRSDSGPVMQPDFPGSFQRSMSAPSFPGQPPDVSMLMGPNLQMGMMGMMGMMGVRPQGFPDRMPEPLMYNSPHPDSPYSSPAYSDNDMRRGPDRRHGADTRHGHDSRHGSDSRHDSRHGSDVRHRDRHRSRGSDVDYHHQQTRMHIEAQLAQARMMDQQRQFQHPGGFPGRPQPWQQSSGRRRQY